MDPLNDGKHDRFDAWVEGRRESWHGVKEVVRFMARNGKRVIVSIVGFAVIAAGLALLVLPGPGLLVIVGGLAILGSEFAWARRALEKAKEKARQAADRLRGRRHPHDEGDSPPNA